MRPASIFSRWLMQRRSVLLPHPLGPTMVRNSPGPTARGTSSRPSGGRSAPRPARRSLPVLRLLPDLRGVEVVDALDEAIRVVLADVELLRDEPTLVEEVLGLLPLLAGVRAPLR